jgi:hypothetical protein
MSLVVEAARKNQQSPWPFQGMSSSTPRLSIRRNRSVNEGGKLLERTAHFSNQNTSMKQFIDLQAHQDFIRYIEAQLSQKIKVVFVITFIRLKR